MSRVRRRRVFLHKTDVALFSLFRAFPRCHHCFRFHLVEEASRPHIIFFLLLCLVVKPLLSPLRFLRCFIKPSFLRHHGGHRGTRLQSAAPECLALRSSKQRVRNLQERHAAHRRSGKKPEESLVEQMKPLLPPNLSKVCASCAFGHSNLQLFVFFLHIVPD